MGVSKQEWKNFKTQVWLGTCKQRYDELIYALYDFEQAIYKENVAEFLAFAIEGGKLHVTSAATRKSAEEASDAMKMLNLEGAQRAFANKKALAAIDGAISAMLSFEGCVRECDIDRARDSLVNRARLVQEDEANMAQVVQDGYLRQMALAHHAAIQRSWVDANQAVNALAEIDKIGIV